MTPEVLELLLDVAAIKPQQTTFGHGSYGSACPVCGGSDYSTTDGSIAHADECVIVRAAKLLAS